MYEPRIPGGTYRDHYWGDTYTVLTMWTDTDRWSPTWLQCRWSDGKVTSHCTAWDPRDTEVVTVGERTWQVRLMHPRVAEAMTQAHARRDAYIERYHGAAPSARSAASVRG